MPTIHQGQADEAVLLCRTLSLFGYIATLFQDHRKLNDPRLRHIKEFVEREVAANPCDERSNMDQAHCHKYFLCEVLSQEAVPGHMDILDVSTEIASGDFCGEFTYGPTTYVNRSLRDEISMTMTPPEDLDGLKDIKELFGDSPSDEETDDQPEP